MGTESRPRPNNSMRKVKHVTENRITYSERFQRTAIERDRKGDKPIDIFRDAELNSRIIGCKRIERCMSRWRARDRETRERGNGERLGDR